MGELLGAFGGGWAGLPPPFGGERGWGGPDGAARPGLTPAIPAEPPLPGPGARRPLRDSMLKEPEGPARPWEPLPAVGEVEPEGGEGGGWVPPAAAHRPSFAPQLEEPPPPAPGQKEDGGGCGRGVGSGFGPPRPRAHGCSLQTWTPRCRRRG